MGSFICFIISESVISLLSLLDPVISPLSYIISLPPHSVHASTLSFILIPPSSSTGIVISLTTISETCLLICSSLGSSVPELKYRLFESFSFISFSSTGNLISFSVCSPSNELSCSFDGSPYSLSDLVTSVIVSLSSMSSPVFSFGSSFIVSSVIVSSFILSSSLFIILFLNSCNSSFNICLISSLLVGAPLSPS